MLNPFLLMLQQKNINAQGCDEMDPALASLRLLPTIKEEDLEEKRPLSVSSTCFKESDDLSNDTDVSSRNEPEHRYLSQSLTSLSSASSYDSYYSSGSSSSSYCSDSCSSQQLDAEECSLEFSDSDDDDDDDNRHLPLFQNSLENIEFATFQESSEGAGENLVPDRAAPLTHHRARGEPAVPRPTKNKKQFCVQCHAWPEVGEHGDPPLKFYDDCYHTLTDPIECAFGGNPYFSLSSLNYAEESPISVARRKAIESVLREQFYLLIQQFAANPEKIARTLYGVSVIDINDLDIATNPTVTAFDRAKVLTVTLVRRLRQWPDLFSDVCKVLSDVPAIQEANAKVRQFLYEECSEDEYSKILAHTAEHHHQSPHSVDVPSDSDKGGPGKTPEENKKTSGGVVSNTTSNTHDIVVEVNDDDDDDIEVIEDAFSHISRYINGYDVIIEDSVSHTSDMIAEDDVSHNSIYSHDIIAEDSVSHTSKISQESDERSKTCHVRSPYSQNENNPLRLHESCLENRSIRSLDALISDDVIDINLRDQNGRTPLIVACLCLPSENPNPTVTAVQRKKIRSLLKKGADANIQDYDGNIALHIAALRQDQEVLKLLLNKAHNMDIAVTNKNSRTALHYACYWGEPGLIAPLLEREREMKSGLLNVRDRNGDTGLHIACRRGFRSIVKELVKEGANRDILNLDGKTAADVAMDGKIAKLVKKKRSLWHFPHRKSVDVTDSAPSSSLPLGSSFPGGGGGGVFYLSEDSDSETEHEHELTESY